MVENKQLTVNVANIPALSYWSSSILEYRSGSLFLDGYEYYLTHGGTGDIQYEYNLAPNDDDTPFTVSMRCCKKYLKYKPFTGCKAMNESLITDRFENNHAVYRLPSKWFNWNPLGKTFKDHFKEAVDSIPTSISEDLSYTETGEIMMVLRPSNLTHAILAFRVINPQLFRFQLFNIINEEVKAVFARRQQGKDVTSFVRSLKDKVAQCGLEAIDENTYGMEGVYGDKYTEPSKWVLTPFIDGYDVRVIKAGDKFFQHTGWHNLKGLGAKMIGPIPVPNTPGDAFGVEIRKIMDNPITPVSGVMDLRLSHSGNYYFLETSHSYSSERYADEFCAEVRNEVLRAFTRAHEDLIGDSNEGWEERYKEEQKRIEAEEEQIRESIED